MFQARQFRSLAFLGVIRGTWRHCPRLEVRSAALGKWTPELVRLPATTADADAPHLAPANLRDFGSCRTPPYSRA
jgi:hypothetical protein